MHRPDVEPGSVDLIWCEGAIYIAGFEIALRMWRHLLVPGGHIAVTEACWMRPDPPPDCAAFWAQEYPAIRDAPALLSVIERCGYETVDRFVFEVNPVAWRRGDTVALDGLLLIGEAAG